MTKTYKHKTLWWIALEYFKSWKFYISRVNDDWTEVEIAINVLPELIWSDREEVVEKDWIDELHNDLFYVAREISVRTLREAIEKHAPKQVKFTREEIEKWADENRPYACGAILDFVKDHNLLSSDEPCEKKS